MACTNAQIQHTARHDESHFKFIDAGVGQVNGAGKRMALR